MIGWKYLYSNRRRRSFQTLAMSNPMEKTRDPNRSMKMHNRGTLHKSMRSEVQSFMNFFSRGISYVRDKANSLKKIYTLLSILALIFLLSPQHPYIMRNILRSGLYGIKASPSSILMFLITGVSLCVGLIIGFKIKTLGLTKIISKPRSNRRYDARKMEEFWSWYNREET